MDDVRQTGGVTAAERHCSAGTVDLPLWGRHTRLDVTFSILISDREPHLSLFRYTPAVELLRCLGREWTARCRRAMSIPAAAWVMSGWWPGRDNRSTGRVVAAMPGLRSTGCGKGKIKRRNWRERYALSHYGNGWQKFNSQNRTAKSRKNEGKGCQERVESRGGALKRGAWVADFPDI